MTKSIKAVLAAIVIFAGMSAASAARAEVRTISMYHVHTRESITVTYWKDGRFIPSALKKLNWFLRDWRKNKVIRIDPRAIDLIYKLHEDLGSKKPVQIICGYRSGSTNAMLRRIGRHVARRSRHIVGQAIDFRFPDIPTDKVRNLALAYGAGGVGYYGRTGFVHIDTGSVRHWPRLPRTRLASILARYRPMVGRRYRRPGGFMLAYGDAARPARATRGRRPVRLASAAAPLRLVKALPGKAAAPLPRPRPYKVLLQAAAAMRVVPVSAPATITNFAGASRAPHDQIGLIIANTSLEDPTLLDTPSAARGARRYPRVNRAGKGDFAAAIRSGSAPGVPLVRPLLAARDVTEADAARLSATPAAMIRRNGAPQPLREPDAPVAASLAASPDLIAAGESQLAGAGRAHPSARASRPATQRVNRSGKGDLLTRRPLRLARKQAFLRAGLSTLAEDAPLDFPR